MFSDWQTPVAIAVVLIAFAALLRRALIKRKNPGCGGGCACPTDTLKAKLKR